MYVASDAKSYGQCNVLQIERALDKVTCEQQPVLCASWPYGLAPVLWNQ